MGRYTLYNNDVAAATFSYDSGEIKSYSALLPALLPMQIRSTTPDGFARWLGDRAIDLNVVKHRHLVNALLGSRDKLAIVLKTNMFSISDTFTCFEEDEMTPRKMLCNPNEQNEISQYILISSETSLRHANIATPNVSTDGSFTKTWCFEDGEWWLYKLQSSDATRAEVEISKVLTQCGWDAAEYRYNGSHRKQVKSRNFVGENEFFEPYDSLRFMFADKSDDDDVILNNLSSLGKDIALTWKRILAADAFLANPVRHMRNFGVIRSAVTGEILRLAPNFDNNQAYRANPGHAYSDSMLRLFLKTADTEDMMNLRTLAATCEKNSYLTDAYRGAMNLL